MYCHLFLILFFFAGNYLKAQCPSEVNANLTKTDVSCGNNGSINIALNSNDVRLFLFKDNSNTPLIEADNITNQQHTFTTLSSGTYKVRAVCKTDLSKVYFEREVTMTNNYKPISNATVTTSTTCGNFSQSGTISVSNVVGGTAPYTYSFIKSNNPAYDDALSNYQSSPTFTANEYGTYQIRVKDACGNFFTVTREVVSTTPPARIEFATEKNSL